MKNMERLSIDEIMKATGGSLLISGGAQETTYVSTDTRTVKPGDLFVALSGENYDAHEFLHEAYDKGCSMVVVSKKDCFLPGHVTAVFVPDTLRALGDIAAYYRKKHSFKVIAVTGSNGKTTTKDMIGTLIKDICDATVTRGTRNNLIGVPLTILDASASQQCLVLELGINQFGEMHRLGEITTPDIAVITNIAQSHLEFLENEDGVFRAKTEILSFMKPDGRLIFLKDDLYYPRVVKKSPCPVITFGIDGDADYCAANLVDAETGVHFDLSIRGEGWTSVSLPIKGEHNVLNFLAAVAAIETNGIPWKQIEPAVVKLALPSMRLEKVIVNNITIINDAYNANPTSTRVAVKELMRLPAAGKKILIFADMLELGAKKELYHQAIGTFLEPMRLDVLITVGDLAALAAQAISNNPQMTKIVLKKSEQVAPILREIVAPGDVVLLKGSRANKLETIIDSIKEMFGAQTL